MATSNEGPTRKEGEPATGKRKEPPHQDEADSGDVSPDEEAPSLHDLSRTEKKRNREKKRREDVNHGFDQLMSLIFMIDPELKAEAEDRKRNSLGDGPKAKPEAPLLSRIELINAAIATLQRVHHENTKRKMTITLLSKGLFYPDNGGVGRPPPAVMPPLAPYVYPQNMAILPTLQNYPGLQPQLNIAALLADPVAGAALRETLRNGNPSGHLQEHFSPSSVFAHSQRGPAPASALPPNHQSLEAILSGIQSAAPLEAILGGRQNNPLGPPSLDTMTLVRELQHGRSSYNQQQRMLNRELSGPNNLLGQSAAPPPALPHGSDIGALLQLLSDEQIQQAMRRNESS